MDAAGSPGAGVVTGDARPAALRVAGIHLRNGALGLARAELEAAAGRGTLDDQALLDLAEARWRTGDLAGAGEVANAFLSSGRRAPIAFVVAAEAVAALGRPSEARRLASLALAEPGSRLDEIFAGMPRSHVWPGEGADDAARDAVSGGAAPSDGSGASAPAASRVEHLPDAPEALDAGRHAIASGDLAAGAVRLAVVLRLDPALAPAVLDAIGSARSPALELVRGDALRATGHELEARSAYASALRAAAESAGWSGGGSSGEVPPTA
ncbi:MAG TPA: hypothetical protein VFK54_04265 [Candidatus Limnocylindrales bacterium]|nr:hypothetical protein [Candidatus Limnocylindrales bacterium]